MGTFFIRSPNKCPVYKTEIPFSFMSEAEKNDKDNFAAKNMLYSRRRGGFVGSHSAQLCTKA